MKCTRMSPKTHWTNVGYTAAKIGIEFEKIKVPGVVLVNEWIRMGMLKYQRKTKKETA